MAEKTLSRDLDTQVFNFINQPNGRNGVRADVLKQLTKDRSARQTVTVSPSNPQDLHVTMSPAEERSHESDTVPSDEMPAPHDPKGPNG